MQQGKTNVGQHPQDQAMDQQCRQAILEKDGSSNISTQNNLGFSSSSPKNNEMNYIQPGYMTKEGMKQCKTSVYPQPQLMNIPQSFSLDPKCGHHQRSRN